MAFEVLREEEFSPLKNADGVPLDTPTTARRSLLAQHYRWALAAGVSFINRNGEPIPPKHRLACDKQTHCGIIIVISNLAFCFKYNESTM